jgi:hypothetical protein
MTMPHYGRRFVGSQTPLEAKRRSPYEFVY